MVDAFPLQWPSNWPRAERRIISSFRTTFSIARYGLLNEVRLLGGKNLVISSNIPVRIDGLPYAKYRTPDDPGIAVYFELNGNNQCIPCDKWTDPCDNLHAIELCINALRGLERWGARHMVSAAFQGFKQLPPHDPDHPDTIIPISKVDYFVGCDTTESLRQRKRSLSKEMHPDKGGDPDEFNIMIIQFDKKMKNLTEGKRNYE